MNKLSTLILYLLTLSFDISAQHTDSMSKMRFNTLVNDLIDNQISGNKIAKPANSGQRLTKIESLENNVLEGYTRFFWGGNRSTMHVPKMFPPYYQPTYAYQQSLEVAWFSRYLKQKPDSVAVYALSGGTMQLFSTESNKFNSSDDLVSRENHFPNKQSSYFTSVVNSDGTISKASFYWDTSATLNKSYVLAEDIFCTYSSAGVLLRDSVYNYNYSSYTLRDYMYDGNGRDTAIWETYCYPALGSPYPGDRYVFDYYPSGLMKTGKLYKLGIVQEMDSLGYNGANSFPTYHSTYRYSHVNRQLELEQEFIYTLNTNGDVVSGLVSRYDNLNKRLDSVSRYNIIYNSFLNPDYILYDFHMFGSWQTNMGRENYYYDLFSDVPQVIKKISLNAYPNPSSDEITVFMDGNQENAVLSLYDMSGRLLKQYITNGEKLIINVKSVPAGSYLLNYESAMTKGSTIIWKD